MSVMGTRVVRIEDHKLITSGGSYVDDLREPELTGAVHAMFVRSPIAHARIGSIDVSAAREAPGVVGVFTADDLDIAFAPGPTGEPWLARDRVRYVGEPVALVLTEHPYQLADVAELVDIDYDPLDAVIDLDDALSGRTLLFDGTDSNVAGGKAKPFDEKLFDDCEVVVTRTITNQRVAPAPLEVRGAACAWGEDGRLTMWLSTQNAQIARDILAGGLGVDPGTVRVIAPDVGGGFGAKIGADPEAVVLGWASRRVGRPVRWFETRSENLTAMTHGRGQRHTVTIGGRRDGTVLAYRLEVVQDAGAYPRAGAGMLPGFTRLMAPGVYRIPRVEVATRSVLTNTTPIAAYRGAGRPEATAAIERAMDLFAAEIGMDPAEVRRINFIRPEEFPYTTPSGASYDTGEYAKALDAVLSAGGYAELRAEQARRREAGDVVVLGLGIAAYVEITAGDGMGESGRVDVNPDGTVTAYTGSSPHGQGLHTSLAMLLSDQFGVPMDKITIRHGDTDEVPKAVGTFASRSLQLGGSVLKQAGDQVIERAKEIAANLLEASPDDVELNVDQGAWQVRGAPSGGTVTWAQVAAAAGEDGLSADVWYGDVQPTFPFGAHLAVVEVDTLTGKAVLRRIIAVDDAGPVVNPVTFQGQRHGGLAQGVAQALLEEMSYDADGNPTTATLADYPFITATELPDFELVDMATPTTRNPLGVKGIGEAATIGSTPAVQNAVVDALAHLGVRHIEMPATPQRVWQAINDAREGR
ncbi:xanthine dehydrogenase family protein molybdopterin-binding subunit [Gandjariella thermophila]|uniref:Carbon-monoxide dehydrogenase large subunit n=1 Tax=Gandjariella thermophila TaxID=1931992 RepID=A0A4D4J4W8_9PSEU|nr:xanthine dehydrogenase family protein molybdopterin-binding subunit [Gandjariella thermophila]GDY29003.1 carbon-monoxide dehydrogenase large subunit [Gandjariella thermophila]